MYSNTDIIKSLNDTIIIEPFNNNQLGINSYDVCLGNTFYEVHWDKDGPFYTGPYEYKEGERVFIPVAGTLLGMTKERVGSKGKVVTELRSRSTTRRKGITTNCDAGLGDVGYADFWTMEFTAFVSNGLIIELLGHLDTWLTRNGLGSTYLSNIIKKRQYDRPYLIVGERVAQMVFYECKSKPLMEYSGQYKADWPLNMIPKEYRDRVK